MERINVRSLSIWRRNLNRLKISALVIVNAGAIYSLNRFKLKGVAVPTNKEERVSDACESVSRQATDWSEA